MDIPLLTAWPIIALVIDVALKAGAIGFILLRRSSRSATSLAWIVIILAVPVVGVASYLLVGETRFGRRRAQRHREILLRLVRPPIENAASAAARSAHIPGSERAIARLIETLAGCVPLGGNRLTLLAKADLYIETLEADIDAARNHCHLLFYIFLPDTTGRRIAAALMNAARRGVKCRLLLDAVGSSDMLGSPLAQEMEAAGVRIVSALPANPIRMLFARLDLRNHRKVVVIDNAIGYVGSRNIADAAFAPKPRFAPWVDASVRLEGPSVVDLHHLFVVDWYLDTNEALDASLTITPPVFTDGSVTQIMGTGPNATNEALPHVILTALHTAREEVILTTPYFVPDAATDAALRSAALRGVRTVLVVPARNDSPFVAAASRSYYADLLEAGVELHEFTEGLLHAKTLTLDRDLALISSANLDRRSFELNFEVSLFAYDTNFASQLRFLQMSYLAASTRVDRNRWRQRSLPSRLVQNAAGMLGPIL